MATKSQSKAGQSQSRARRNPNEAIRATKPVFRRFNPKDWDDWVHAVTNGDTLLGYHDWVQHQRESDAPVYAQKLNSARLWDQYADDYWQATGRWPDRSTTSPQQIDWRVEREIARRCAEVFREPTSGEHLRDHIR